MAEGSLWEDRIYTENILEDGEFLGRIEVTMTPEEGCGHRYVFIRQFSEGKFETVMLSFEELSAIYERAKMYHDNPELGWDSMD